DKEHKVVRSNHGIYVHSPRTKPFSAPHCRYGGWRGHGGGRRAPGRHMPRHGPHKS
ncbi:hypothetical protein ACLOJK_019720, partial [Asimina triloba]